MKSYETFRRSLGHQLKRSGNIAGWCGKKDDWQKVGDGEILEVKYWKLWGHLEWRDCKQKVSSNLLIATARGVRALQKSGTVGGFEEVTSKKQQRQ